MHQFVVGSGRATNMARSGVRHTCRPASSPSYPCFLRVTVFLPICHGWCDVEVWSGRHRIEDQEVYLLFLGRVWCFGPSRRTPRRLLNWSKAWRLRASSRQIHDGWWSDGETWIQFNKIVDRVERIQFNKIVEQGARRAHCAAMRQASHASQMGDKFALVSSPQLA